MKQLPLSTKTRKNLIQTFETTGILPTYYRFYEDDILVLSTLLESTFVTIDRHTTYQFYFMYFKLG